MDHTQKLHSNAFRSNFKMTKLILVSNIFYHFLFAVSFVNRASKMSEKLRIYRNIGFQNTFYTKSINVTIDSIGPSIILRSIYTMHNKFSNFLCFASFCAHLCAVPINFNCIDENRILGK